MAIGDKIRHYRESLQMTQEDLAKALETTPQNIYKYEKGIILNIPLNKIQAMAKIFNTTPADLIGWNDETPTPFDIAKAKENEPENTEVSDLSQTEKNIIRLYRSNPSFRAFVDSKLQTTSPYVMPLEKTRLKFASNPMPAYNVRKKDDE